jgi:hypothetical protein
MGHIGGDVEEVSCPNEEISFQSFAMPHTGFSAKDINGSFMGFMLMRFRSSTGRNGHNLQVDFPCTDGFR